MRIQTGSLVAIVENQTLKRFEEASIPWAYRMTCARFSAAVLTEYQRFAKLRLELVKACGGKELAPGTLTVNHEDNPSENIAKFSEGLQALLNDSVDLPVPPLSLEKLGGETCNLSVADLRLLSPFLVD